MLQAIKVKLLNSTIVVTLLILSLFNCSHAKSSTFSTNEQLKGYWVNTKFLAKYSNKRRIGQAAILSPIIYNDKNLIFINVIGMMDNLHSNEGNFGLGFRHLFTNSILGIYSFYDIRTSDKNTPLHQINFGIEHLTQFIDLRANGYFPLQNRVDTSFIPVGRVIDGPIWSTIETETVENFITPLFGYDFGVGCTIPKLDRVKLNLAYYHYFRSGSTTVKGVRLRAQLNIYKWLYATAERSFGIKSDSFAYVGAKLIIPFGVRNIENQPLLMKMIQFPVRDIDVIVSKQKEAHDKKSTRVKGNVYLINNNSETVFSGGKSRDPDTLVIYDETTRLNIYKSGDITPQSTGTHNCSRLSKDQAINYRSHLPPDFFNVNDLNAHQYNTIFDNLNVINTQRFSTLNNAIRRINTSTPHSYFDANYYRELLC